MDRIKTAKRWMQHVYGRACLAPFTGQDARAWGAFVMLLDLYAAADNPGRRNALNALASCVLAAQSHVAPLFLQVVPFVIDGRDGAILSAELALALDAAAEAADEAEAVRRAYDDGNDEPQD